MREFWPRHIARWPVQRAVGRCTGRSSSERRGAGADRRGGVEDAAHESDRQGRRVARFDRAGDVGERRGRGIVSGADRRRPVLRVKVPQRPGAASPVGPFDDPHAPRSTDPVGPLEVEPLRQAPVKDSFFSRTTMLAKVAGQESDHVAEERHRSGRRHRVFRGGGQGWSDPADTGTHSARPMRCGRSSLSWSCRRTSLPKQLRGRAGPHRGTRRSKK